VFVGVFSATDILSLTGLCKTLGFVVNGNVVLYWEAFGYGTGEGHFISIFQFATEGYAGVRS